MEITLRQWRQDDAVHLAKYADNPRIAEFLREGFPQPFTLQSAESFIENCLNANPAEKLFFAIAIDDSAAINDGNAFGDLAAQNGLAVGSIGIFRKDNVYRMGAELAYWLGEPFWGRGLMTRAVRLACGIGFSRLGLARISAEPYAHNAGSRRVLEKAGFTLEGVHKNSVFKNGRFFDACTYAVLRGSIEGALPPLGRQPIET